MSQAQPKGARGSTVLLMDAKGCSNVASCAGSSSSLAASRASEGIALSLALVGRVEAVIDVSGAQELAEAKLAVSLPRRWRHVRSVARRARWVAKELSLSDDLVAAAWLHDIGYAPELVETGFHPLDGARYLRRDGC